jgi:hypothetical protein
MIRSNRLWILLSLAVPLTTIAPFATSVALAETPAAEARAEGGARQPATPAALDGRFQRYILAPDGRITALVLQDGTVVHVRPHAADEPAANLRAGEPLHVEGGLVKTPTGAMIVRAVVQQGGKVIADGSKEHGHRGHRGEGREGREGKGKHAHAQLQPIVATARVSQIVSSPRGRVHEVLLDDGTSAFGQLDSLGLKVGDRVTVAGKGGAYPQGKALRVDTITLPSGEVRTLPKPERHGHGRKGPPAGSAPA